MRILPSSVFLGIVGLAGWAGWLETQANSERGASAAGKTPVTTARAAKLSHGGRVEIPLAPEGKGKGKPFPTCTTEDKPLTEAAALREKVLELRKRRAETPRAVARALVMERGLSAVIEHRVPLNATREQYLKTVMEQMRPDPNLTREENLEAARKLASATETKLKAMEELWEEYRMETIKWLKEEREHADAVALEDIKRAGGEIPKDEDLSGRAVADPLLHPRYRAASDLMEAGDFAGAQRAFAALAENTSGGFREQAQWNALLSAMAAGSESGATDAARELLRGSASTAAFAMAALAMRDAEWGEAQIWVDQAVAHGDPAENESLGNALRGLGWMEAGVFQVAPPPE